MAYQATPLMRTITLQLIGFHMHHDIINTGETEKKGGEGGGSDGSRILKRGFQCARD